MSITVSDYTQQQQHQQQPHQVSQRRHDDEQYCGSEQNTVDALRVEISQLQRMLEVNAGIEIPKICCTLHLNYLVPLQNISACAFYPRCLLCYT